MLERLITFKKPDKPEDPKWLKASKKPFWLMIAARLLYAVIVFFTAMHFSPGAWATRGMILV